MFALPKEFRLEVGRHDPSFTPIEHRPLQPWITLQEQSMDHADDTRREEPPELADSRHLTAWLVRFRGLPARFEIHVRENGQSRVLSPTGGFTADNAAERWLTGRGVAPNVAANVVANARRNGLAAVPRLEWPRLTSRPILKP